MLLFTTNPDLARRADLAGIDGLIVDCECKGKADRLVGRNMEINADTPEDVVRVAAAASCPVIVRINASGPYTEEEIGLAIASGARGVMLPMARSADEVAEFISLVGDRVRTIVPL